MLIRFFGLLRITVGSHAQHRRFASSSEVAQLKWHTATVEARFDGNWQANWAKAVTIKIALR